MFLPVFHLPDGFIPKQLAPPSIPGNRLCSMSVLDSASELGTGTRNNDVALDLRFVGLQRAPEHLTDTSSCPPSSDTGSYMSPPSPQSVHAHIPYGADTALRPADFMLTAECCHTEHFHCCRGHGRARS